MIKMTIRADVWVSTADALEACDTFAVTVRIHTRGFGALDQGWIDCDTPEDVQMALCGLKAIALEQRQKAEAARAAAIAHPPRKRGRPRQDVAAPVSPALNEPSSTAAVDPVLGIVAEDQRA